MNGTIAGIVVVVVLALVAIVMARRGKAQASEWDLALAALGIEPVSPLDPKLADAIIALHRPPARDGVRETWSLIRAGRYPEPGVNCYSVTLHVDRRHENWRGSKTPRTESSESRVVAIVTPESLRAPRMQLLPRAIVEPGAGALVTMAAEAANAIIDSAAEHGGNRVEFTDDPDFERRYFVLSPERDPARAFLDPARRRQLAALDGVQASVEGSLLLVSSATDAIRHRGRSMQESLSAELENARRVLKTFAVR